MADQLRVVFDGAQLQDAAAVGGGTVMGSRLPRLRLAIKEGQGVLASIRGRGVKIGTASQGELHRITAISGLKPLQAIYGQGELVDAASLDVQAGVAPLLLRAKAGIAGTISEVVADVTNTGTGMITAAGSAQASHDIRIEMTRDGTVTAGDGGYRYSLDGGDSWSGEFALTPSASIAGLTLGFDAEEFKKGDGYRLKTAAPQMRLDDIMAAWDALLASGQEVEYVHIVGAISPVTAQALLTRVHEAWASGRYLWLLVEARGYTNQDVPSDFANDFPEGHVPDWGTLPVTQQVAINAHYASNIQAEWADVVGKGIAVAAGMSEVYVASARHFKPQNTARLATARLVLRPISEHLGRVRTGALAGVVGVHYDASTNPTLHTAGFTTMRTLAGRRGVYFSSGLTRAEPDSVFRGLHNLRVVLEVCRLAQQRLLLYLNESLRVDPTTGFLLEIEAKRIELDVEAFVRSAVVVTGDASAVQVHVRRDTNILLDQTLYANVSVTLLGYAEQIRVEVVANALQQEVTNTQEGVDDGSSRS